MSTTGLPAFDETLHLTNAWLKELMAESNWKDRHGAYLALRVVLQGLRDHLSVEQAAKLGSQLPMLVRGFYYEGWHPAHKPLKDRSRADFLKDVVAGFRQSPTDDPIDPAAVVGAVCRLLDRHLTPGVTDHVKRALPRGVRQLWPDGTKAEAAPRVAVL